MEKLMLSAFSDEYADALCDQLEGLSELGIGYTEVRHINGKNIATLTSREVKEASALIAAHGIGVSAVGSPLGKVVLEGEIDAHLETARRVFESAHILGTRYVRAFSFYAPEGRCIADMRSEVLDALEKLVRLAEREDIILCHENEAGIYGDTPARIGELLAHFDGALRCVFDMGNFVLEGVEPLAAYRLLKPHVAYFHIKDALFAGAIVPPGKGEACIKEILTEHEAFAQTPFFASLEPHLETFSGLNALVGRPFRNPYRYSDAKTAFADATAKCKELLQ